jgi:carboxymethylenebutenolidase
MPETDINKLKNLNSEVLFVWAKKDQWINEQVKNEFIENMKAADKRLTVKEYDADHAFANPSNPHFDESDASEAQKITLNFLRSHFE